MSIWRGELTNRIAWFVVDFAYRTCRSMASIYGIATHKQPHPFDLIQTYFSIC